MNSRLTFFAPFFFVVAPLLAQQIVEQPAAPAPVVVVQNYPAAPSPLPYDS